MKKDKKISRKDFLKLSGRSIIFGLLLAFLLSCTGSTETTEDYAITITSNHGHSLELPERDVNNGTQKTYNIKGTAGHSHTLTITSANFNDIRKCNSTSINSSTDSSHSHTVTIKCK